MDSVYHFAILTSLLIFASLPSLSFTALVNPPPLRLGYHHGPLLKGSIPVSLIWYGNFSTIQRCTIVDFIQSLSSPAASPHSVSSWWNTTGNYNGGSTTLVVGQQILDDKYSLGKSLKTVQLLALAAEHNSNSVISVVLTAADVAVQGFCMSRCGTHGTGVRAVNGNTNRFPYAWVGNSVTQCPGQCAWPFHKPVSGPQLPPLVSPNRDVGVDGMVINLATVLAGTVTNPYGDGFFQGPATAPLEAVSACAGIFGIGAYPGYPGRLLVDTATEASYNANGVNERKYLLPAMWDPHTAACKTPL